MKKTLLSVFTLMMPLAAAAQSNSCLMLPEAVELALDTAPAASRADAERQIRKAQLLAARAAGLPQIGLFGQTGIGDSTPIDTARDDQIGVRANFEFFTFGARSAEVTAARELLRAAESGERQAQVNVAQEVIILYLELLRAERVLSLTSAQTEGYAREAATVSGRLSRGLVTRADARQVEARYAAALARKEEADIRRDEVLLQLSIFTGGDVPCVSQSSAQALSTSLVATVGYMQPSEAVRLAENRAFSLRQAKAEVRSAEADLRRARREGLPKVSFDAFYLSQYDDSELPVDDRWTDDDRIGFSFRQDFFTSGRLAAGRAESRGRLRLAEADLFEEEQQLQNTVRRALLGVQRQGAVAARRTSAAKAAEDRLAATQLELRRGTKTITDFVLANEDYYIAAIEEASASYIRDQELVRLAAVTGRLFEVDLLIGKLSTSR